MKISSAERMLPVKLALIAGLVLPLSACGAMSGLNMSSLNPFKEKEVTLPGKRIAVLKPEKSLQVDAAIATTSISLPFPVANPSWSQPGGTPSNAPGHLALSTTLRTVWSADAGEGSSSDGRLTASPIVFQGKVLTLDTEGKLSAFSVSSGNRVWRTSLTPENENEEEGYGGGIAADGGKVFVATGYGTVNAVNPANGKILWTQKVGVPVRSSPTAADGRIFLVTTEGRLVALSAEDGAEIWSRRGIPERATLLGNVSPAVSGDTVVVPFPSGDVIAYKVDSGQPVWGESLTRTRSRSSFTSLSDPASPAIDGGVIFAVSHAGKMIATSKKTGERLWSLSVRGTQTPWVAGNMVYVVDVGGKLLALTRKSGKVRWIAQLDNKDRWSGPVLGGGKLWLVSGGGRMVGIDAKSGKIVSRKDIGTKTLISPVIASGRMFVLTDKARLLALK